MKSKIQKLIHIKEKELALAKELAYVQKASECSHRIIGDDVTRFIVIDLKREKDVCWGAPSRIISFFNLRRIHPTKILDFEKIPSSAKKNPFINSFKND